MAKTTKIIVLCCISLSVCVCVGNDWGNWIFAVVCSYTFDMSRNILRHTKHTRCQYFTLLACCPIDKPPEIMIAMQRCVNEICSYSVFLFFPPPMRVCVLKCNANDLNYIWPKSDCHKSMLLAITFSKLPFFHIHLSVCSFAHSNIIIITIIDTRRWLTHIWTVLVGIRLSTVSLYLYLSLPLARSLVPSFIGRNSGHVCVCGIAIGILHKMLSYNSQHV